MTRADVSEATYTQSPAVIAPIVWGLCRGPLKVVDYGCNAGWWLEAFAQLGSTELIGFDVAELEPDAPLRLMLDQGYPPGCHSQFNQVDFEETVPVCCADLAISLENAEHISERRADLLVQRLCGSRAVLFSAATPGQGGDGHINEQWHQYWHRKFAANGFAFHDVIRPMVENDEQVLPWYRANCFLYTPLMGEPLTEFGHFPERVPPARFDQAILGEPVGHDLSNCCQAAVARIGAGRVRCSSCGKTWEEKF